MDKTKHIPTKQNPRIKGQEPNMFLRPKNLSRRHTLRTGK